MEMPQILVLTDSPQRSGEVVYRERVAMTCLESEHFSHQLLERVGWAVQDADAMEHEAKAHGAKAHEALASAEVAQAPPEPEPAWHPAVAVR
jgi:hypothetical protein